MSPIMHLFALRELDRDAGTLVSLDDLHPMLRSKVEPLVCGESGLLLRLPFLDHKECRRRKIVFKGLRFKRIGEEIGPCLDAARQVREHAAEVALTHEAWQASPQQRGPAHFAFWQPVAVDLQRSLREWMLEESLKSDQFWDNRLYAYTLAAYCGSRVFRGRNPDFTYEFIDYPHRDEVVETSLRMCVQSLMRVLTRIEGEMMQRDLPALARRYSPIWAEDILRDVQRSHKQYVKLLSADAALVNAAITLGTKRNGAAINGYHVAVRRHWGRLLGKRLHFIGSRVLDRVTELLSSQRSVDRSEDILHGRVPERLYMTATRSPDLRISV